MLPKTTTVLIAGAGPAGLACAVSLLVSGVNDIAIVDAQPAGVNSSRAIVIHARTIEEVETIGIAETLVERGLHAGYMTIRAKTTVLAQANFTSLQPHTQYPYALLVSQTETEEILEQRLNALGVSVLRPHRVVGFEGTSEGISVTFESGEVIKTRFLVGADGARSVIRKIAGIPFRDPSTKKNPMEEVLREGESIKDANVRLGRPLVIADVHLKGHIPPCISPTDLATFLGPLGFLLLVPLPALADDPDGRTVYRLSCPAEPGAKEVTKERLQTVIDTAFGLPKDETPIIDNILWASRFRVRSAAADTFYTQVNGGIVALVGDAAHVHSPAGGQGMNLGLRDAIALGKAIADILSKEKSAVFSKKPYANQRLDKYSKERRAMALKVIKMTKVLTWATGLESKNARKTRDIVWWLMGRTSFVNNKLARRLSGLKIGVN